jgi:hypothetical protein
MLLIRAPLYRSGAPYRLLTPPESACGRTDIETGGIPMQAKLLAALLVLTAAPALAQSAEPARYQLISVSGGFVRLDMVSGVMTFCRDEVDSFRCSPISTENAKAKQPEAGVQPNSALEPKRHSERLGGDSGDQDDMTSGDRGRHRDRVGRDGDDDTFRKSERGFKDEDSIENFDRALSMMQRAMRGFMAMSKEHPRDCAL